MYYAFELSKTPNQSFNVNIGDNNFEFTLRTFRKILYATVSINGSVVCASVPCTPNKSLFPNSVNSIAGGRFAFLMTQPNEYPSYEMFDGLTCRFAFEPYDQTMEL